MVLVLRVDLGVVMWVYSVEVDLGVDLTVSLGVGVAYV